MTTLRVGLLALGDNKAEALPLRLHSRGYQVVELNKASELLGQLYIDPPDIVLVDLRNRDETWINIIRDIKQDSYFSMMPVLGLVPAILVENEDLTELPIDDFISLPLNYPELFNRITLATQRIRRVLDNNPLTRLPGNTSIQLAIEQAINDDMAVCYLDINNFKPYNDTYGFARGDEVIRMVARITSNAIKETCDNGFSGHIGGDDFVFIVPLKQAPIICQTILDNFELVVSDLFGKAEKTARFYIAKNRKGEEEKIPLLGVAIAIVPTNNELITHPGKVAEIASELKKLAKKSDTSQFVIDRRIKPRKISG
jgi:diguanylate cyclase (GGDEF)-like protein